jgi:hypothetical protein
MEARELVSDATTALPTTNVNLLVWMPLILSTNMLGSKTENAQ